MRPLDTAEFTLEPLTVSLQTTLRLTGDSRATIYRALAEGELIGLKSGRSLRIDYQSIKDRHARQPRAAFRAPKAA
jgi:hypothetical protein